MTFLYVFIGGGIGSILRYGMNLLLDKYSSNFPFATISANALACILFGYFAGYILKDNLDVHYRLFLLTGVCGGFSTFSAFTNDTYRLFNDGQLLAVFGNIIFSVVICLACLLIGYKWSAQ